MPTDLALKGVDAWVYTIDVKLGQEGKVVPMLVDTGSYTFWAADKACADCISGGMVGALASNPEQCTPYQTSYKTGGFKGCLVNTTMEFGPYKMQNMAMAAATDVGDELTAHGNGMFGLAMVDRIETTTPMSRMLSDGLVDDPWVGLRLQRQGEGDSEVIFGNALKSTYGDSAFHVDLPQRKGGGTKYNVTLDSFAIMGQPVKDSLITNSGMLLDTGTSNIVVPDSKYEWILKALVQEPEVPMHPQLKTAMIPCKGRGNVAEALSFTFGGVAFPVPWKDLVGPEIDLAGTPFAGNGTGVYCEPRIQKIPGNSNWILGDAFLVNVYHAVNTQTGGVQIWRLKP